MNTWWKKYITSPVINTIGKAREQYLFDDPPVLIGGCARSGTSLLLSILSAHPNIHAIPVESDAFTEWNESGKPVRLDRFYRQLLFGPVKKGAGRWCEKRPYNVRYIAEILTYFEAKVRFIHIIRDPRAVCTSVHPQKPNQYWVSPDRYIHDVTIGLAYESHPNVLSIKFEDLITKQEDTLQAICHFLKEPYTEELKDWINHATIKTNRAWFERLNDIKELRAWDQPIHQARLQEVLSNTAMLNLMAKLGYS